MNSIIALGKANLPVCIVKNQYSFSSDPKFLGRARDFSFELRAGSGFIVIINYVNTRA
ncbi:MULTISPECIES: formate--tetrahydrofolate ligase [unclassified Campylobacter]|uniref:formate--tetrahydrofolate ligase n=1 Tax=unclassified Campylobacter TaxID=2593542 RepID=UPI00201620BA|nr:MULTISPECIES: formate--tetrahydrofolate ligase [unclassified Campylobacter]